MMHWIYIKGENLSEELEEAVTKTNWNMQVSSSEGGPINFQHSDGSEITLVDSTITSKIGVEYVPSDSADAAVNLNKGSHHHTSFMKKEGENAVDWTVHILERHEVDK